MNSITTSAATGLAAVALAFAPARESWEAFDITAQCRPAGNGWQPYIWLLH